MNDKTRLSMADGDAIIDTTIKSCRELLTVKGADYTEGLYRTRNFDEVATRVGISRFAVWSVYFQKHLSAIETFLKKGRVESEPIEERIQDAINYLLLLGVMIEEERRENKKLAYQRQAMEARRDALRAEDDGKIEI